MTNESESPKSMQIKKSHLFLLVLLIMAASASGAWLYLHYVSQANSTSGSLPTESRLTGNCNLAAQTCAIEFSDMIMEVVFLKAPKYLQPFDVEVVLRGQSALQVEMVKLQFEMQGMDMALPATILHKGTTSELQTSRWRNTVMIPVCATGRNDWLVKVTALGPSKKYQAAYQLRMQ